MKKYVKSDFDFEYNGAVQIIYECLQDLEKNWSSSKYGRTVSNELVDGIDNNIKSICHKIGSDVLNRNL